MDAHCSLLGRPASDTDCSNAVCAASPEQLAHCKGCARGQQLAASATRFRRVPLAVNQTMLVMEDDMASKGTCKACGREAPLPARGLCWSCYTAYRKGEVVDTHERAPSPSALKDTSAAQSAPAVPAECGDDVAVVPKGAIIIGGRTFMAVQTPPSIEKGTPRLSIRKRRCRLNRAAVRLLGDASHVALYWSASTRELALEPLMEAVKGKASRVRKAVDVSKGAEFSNAALGTLFPTAPAAFVLSREGSYIVGREHNKESS